MQAVWEYRWQLLDGTIVTIELAISAVVLSITFGLLGAWAKLGGNPLLGKCANTYTTVVRGIPDLVLMLLLFYGGQQLLVDIGTATGLWDYIEINQFMAGCMTLGFVYGAYMSETFRGAIMAIPKGQIEAAVACGMPRRKVFTRVIWPQMVRYAIPGFTNNWLVLIKGTALVSVIGVHDIVYNGFVAGRSTRQLFTFMLVVLVVYLVLTAISDYGLRRLDRRYNVGVRRLTET